MSLYCPYCAISNSASSGFRNVKWKGYFSRTSDGFKPRRIMCRDCGRTSSEATQDPNRNQKKRMINSPVGVLVASGVTQRRCARLVGVNRKTIARKVLILQKQAEVAIDEANRKYGVVFEIQFDEMETFEQSKKLPLSAVVAVAKNRRILGLEVAQMPCRGTLAKASREKYGKRKDTRKPARNQLFERIAPYVHPNAVIESDQNPHYPLDVKRHFPHATHITYKSRRAKANGFGELKIGAHDPLFAFNHTAASFRGNLACLARRTWSTSKRQFGLRARMMIYAHFHNQTIEMQEARKAKGLRPN